jgi:hypothetical protein
MTASDKRLVYYRAGPVAPLNRYASRVCAPAESRPGDRIRPRVRDNPWGMGYGVEAGDALLA